MKRTNKKRIRTLPFLITGLFLAGTALTQTLEEETPWKNQTSAPKSIDFSKMFEEEQTTREDFEKLKDQREAKLRQLMSQPAAIEKAVDPQTYIVGPGDIFSFNIWGPMEMQYPVTVNAEGKLLLPSIGEIHAAGKTLANVQHEVLEKAGTFYKSSVTLSLETLRYFRVHVVGAVQYPGTYAANPTSRISELIEQAGGISGWANKTRIELRKENGDTIYYDLAAFEAIGDLASDSFVHGGDVIYVPPIDLSSRTVRVEGDFQKGGKYPIMDDENIYDFLLRIGPFSRSVNLSQVSVIRRKGKEIRIYKPLAEGQNEMLLLENDDRVIIPSDFVYVKGAVQNPGAYPFVANLTARDYAGMAGGTYQSTNIKGVKVYNQYTGKTKHGPETLVEAGDVVDLPQSWGNRFRDLATVLSTVTSAVLAAKAIGLFGK